MEYDSDYTDDGAGPMDTGIEPTNPESQIMVIDDDDFMGDTAVLQNVEPLRFVQALGQQQQNRDAHEAYATVEVQGQYQREILEYEAFIFINEHNNRQIRFRYVQSLIMDAEGRYSQNFYTPPHEARTIDVAIHDMYDIEPNFTAALRNQNMQPSDTRLMRRARGTAGPRNVLNV